MIQLIDKMTTIYFRLPDGLGVTHEQLRNLINIESKPYTNEDIAKINDAKRQIEEAEKRWAEASAASENRMDRMREASEDIFEARDRLRVTEREVRPFGKDLHFFIEKSDADRLAFYAYSIEETLSADEVEYIKNYIKETLKNDDVLFDIVYYDVNDTFSGVSAIINPV